MRRPLWALSCLVLASAGIASAQQFTYNAAALPAQNIWTDGVELVDVDADNDIDIVFANGSSYGGVGGAGAQAQHLFLNNGAGVFAAAHAQLNVANFNAKMVIAEDFDNDGDPDLMYASGSTGSPPRILMNNGLGIFADETGARIPVFAANPRSFSVCAGDVDDDGDLDVAVSDGGTFGGIASQAILLKNDGTGVFTNVTAAQMPVDLYNCQDITFLDFDGDFDLDMALSGKGSVGKQGRLYLNDGSGTFSINTVMNAVGTGNTYEADFADLDADSDFDSAVQSISVQSEGWARNDGTAVAMVKTTFAAPNGNDDNEMACMDYNNDGRLDVFVGNLNFQEKVYRNLGGGSFINANAVIQAVNDTTLDIGFADLNGDDKYDLVTAQGEGNHVDKVFMNSGSADMLPPVLVAVQVPGALGDPETVFHLRVRDQIADDAHVNVTVGYAWSTTTDAGGSGDAMHQGSGQFRAAVPTPAGTTSASITFTATDSAGNAAVFGPYAVGTPSPWTNLGGGLAGVAGVPTLIGAGPLTTGSAGSLILTTAAPSAMSSMFVSLSSTPANFKCGVLVPVPIVFQLILFTNGSGNLPLAWAAWPNGLSGASLYFQYAIVDGAAICGTAISNAVRADVP
ncbi:MAG TPA: VCBS repeat-containing protein [Planctomycetota bacterium]|nr:VCBS repeat-containing protein [Planctomycetota bacterium]